MYHVALSATLNQPFRRSARPDSMFCVKWHNESFNPREPERQQFFNQAQDCGFSRAAIGNITGFFVHVTQQSTSWKSAYSLACCHSTWCTTQREQDALLRILRVITTAPTHGSCLVNMSKSIISHAKEKKGKRRKERSKEENYEWRQLKSDKKGKMVRRKTSHRNDS